MQKSDNNVNIKRTGSQQSANGPPEWLTMAPAIAAAVVRVCSDAATLTIRNTMLIDGAKRYSAMLVSSRRALLATSVLLACLAAGTYAERRGATLALTYDAQTRGPAPIPPSERSLQTVVAEPWFKVSDAGIVLEGPAFERNGNLVFCDVSGQRVLRLTPTRSPQSFHTSQWRTGSRSAQTERSFGLRSSAETSYTGSNWRTRRPSRHSARPFPIASSARHRTRCGRTATAISMWQCTVKGPYWCSTGTAYL